MLLPLLDALKGLVDNIGMCSLLSLLAVDSSDLIGFGNDLDGGGSGSQDVGGILGGEGKVQAEQHILVLGSQNFHADLQSGFVESLIREVDFVFARFGGQQFHLLPLLGVVAVVVDVDADSGFAQIDAFGAVAREVVGDSKNDIERGVFHDHMDVTGNPILCG